VETRFKRGPLISSGILMGAGLGGFVDGILFHQILQTHNMLSGKIPVNDLISAKVNMVWDGFFHAAVWIITCIGLALLFRAGRRKDVPWSGRMFFGSLLIGWGVFNLAEGIIDHEILGIHHVYEYTLDHAPADLAFLAAGALLTAIGLTLIRKGSFRMAPRGEARLVA
jgi:uncharacterized membrane protein